LLFLKVFAYFSGTENATNSSYYFKTNNYNAVLEMSDAENKTNTSSAFDFRNVSGRISAPKF